MLDSMRSLIHFFLSWSSSIKISWIWARKNALLLISSKFVVELIFIENNSLQSQNSFSPIFSTDDEISIYIIDALNSEKPWIFFSFKSWDRTTPLSSLHELKQPKKMVSIYDGIVIVFNDVG